MNFFESWPEISWSVFVIALVATTGLLFGNLRVRGIGLGSGGVLFAGLAFAQCGADIDENILKFAKEFGLILFVFTIGIQLGPGIIGLWRQQGLKLNAIAAVIVFIGALMTILLGYLLDINHDATIGLFSGATTNTPSLGAAQQVLSERATDGSLRGRVLALAYAVVYPGAILGIIGSILILKKFFQIDMADEEFVLKEQDRKIDPVERRNLVIENPNLNLLPISKIPGREETGVRISRIWRKEEDLVHPALDESIVHQGDVILAVGTTEALNSFQMVVGSVSDMDLMKVKGDAQFKRVVVTNKKILGKTLRELGLDQMWNVTVTRVIRSGAEMTASGSTHIQFGDLLRIVGGDVESASKFLGNSPNDMNQTQFIPFFVGIALGVFVGMIPIAIPGLPVPVRLGLAGGPLIVAVILSLIGNLGTLVWYIPANANRSMRELGMVLFLACVGLHAGGNFLETVLTPTGLKWVIAGVFITMTPLLITGIYARKVKKMNFITLSGLFAGSMTDPPALAFANSYCNSEASTASYAAVYPLAMILRILTAQILVLLFC